MPILRNCLQVKGWQLLFICPYRATFVNLVLILKVLHKDKELSEVFRLELQKHDAKRKIIGQNLLAQENILQALTETNAR